MWYAAIARCGKVGTTYDEQDFKIDKFRFVDLHRMVLGDFSRAGLLHAIYVSTHRHSSSISAIPIILLTLIACGNGEQSCLKHFGMKKCARRRARR